MAHLPFSVSALPSNFTADGGEYATDVLAYHIVYGNFTGANATYTNTTIGRTLLSDPQYVNLEGGEHQVVVWATREDGLVHVLNQM